MDNYFGEFTQKDFLIQKYSSLVSEDNPVVYLTIDNKNCTINVGIKEDFLNNLMYKKEYCDDIIETTADMIRADNIKFTTQLGEVATLQALLTDIIDRLNKLEQQ